MIVTVDEVKTHLRIEHNEEDSYIEGLIKQAQAEAEDYCRVSFEEPDEEGNIPDVPEPVRLAVILMTSFYYENRDIPDMTTYKATRMAFDNLLYRYRDPDVLMEVRPCARLQKLRKRSSPWGTQA